jgi:hypothetical protein
VSHNFLSALFRNCELLLLLDYSDNNMDVSTEELNLSCQAEDFEHVYIKQEQQVTSSSTFMIIKNEDKVKYMFPLC